MPQRRILELLFFAAALCFMSYYIYEAYVLNEAEKAVLTPDERAKLMFDKALAGAEEGDPDAQYEVAKHYFYGNGVMADIGKSLAWYEKAAQNGHIAAQKYLAHAYKTGEYATKDMERSIFHYTQLSEGGDLAATVALAWIYQQDETIPGHKLKAVVLFKEAAEKGDIDSYFMLGRAYYYGDGFPQDYEKAFYWMNKAQENSANRSPRLLARMHHEGQGTPKNLVKAGQLIPQIMRLEDEQYNEEITRYIDTHVENCQKAQKANLAIHVLESCLFSAEAGIADSQYMTARMITDGLIDQTMTEKPALDYYRMAAMQGHLEAQIELARRYGNGEQNTPIDLAETYVWLYLISHQPADTPEIQTIVAQARQNIQSLSAKLSADEKLGAEEKIKAYQAALAPQ